MVLSAARSKQFWAARTGRRPLGVIMEPQGPVRSHRAPSKFPIRFLIVAIVFLAGSFSWAIVHHASAPVADPTTLSVVEECQRALGYPARSPADIEWLQQCVSALTPPTVPPTTPPTVPPSTTSSPSTTPTPSASPTIPPTTIPPTVPPTTTPPVTTSTAPTTTPPVSTTPGTCPVAGKDKPGASDHWGGCWPGPGNTGVPAGTVLTTYTGSCNITVANTIIDSKIVNCDLVIRAANVVIRKSEIHGSVNGLEGTGSSYMLMDSLVTNPARSDCLCVGSDNFVVSRSEIRGAYREIYCRRNCVVTDTWVHGQQ